MNLLTVEMRRALHRRVVWVLVILALVGCVTAGVLAFTGSVGKTVAELRAEGDTHPALMADWWVGGGGDGILMIASLFLLLGGALGGASVAGAEWRAHTITTVLTWEPRRVRLHATRTAAAALLAFVISFALQAVFLAAFVPTVLHHGSTAGTDAGWWAGLVLAMARTSLLTAIAATLGVSLATIGRNTTFALMAIFAWMAVIEGLIRGLKPGLAQYLWGENIGTVIPWGQLPDSEVVRSPVLALVTVVGYCTAIALVATVFFKRRDVAGLA